MRVFLGVQIPSQSMIRMIKYYCEESKLEKIEDYEPMIELFNSVDLLWCPEIHVECNNNDSSKSNNCRVDDQSTRVVNKVEMLLCLMINKFYEVNYLSHLFITII